jgi:hypothetical protein
MDFTSRRPDALPGGVFSEPSFSHGELSFSFHPLVVHWMSFPK